MTGPEPIFAQMDAIMHFDAFRKHHHDQAAQAAGTETTAMSKLADAQHFIADLASNPLVEQIAEEGLGLLLTPAEASAAIGLIRELEAAHKAEAQAQQPQDADAPQPQPAPNGVI